MNSDPHRLLVERRVLPTLRELGIPVSLATERRQSLHLDCEDLVSVGLDLAGREAQLERSTAASWWALRDAAARDGVALGIVSAFRSFDYQRQIIASKLAAGKTIEEILRVSALPGFSEHHTGRAIDMGTPGSQPLTAAFAETTAYTWLTQHAFEFGFRLSYPQNNPHGIIFEPWHWLHA